MKRFLTLVCLLVLTVIALAAPRPLSRPKPAVKPMARPEPGEYGLSWCNCAYAMTLRSDGSYSCGMYTNACWQGYWTWDPSTRLFSVRETANEGATWLVWSVTLDDTLAGYGMIEGGKEIEVGLKPITAGKKPDL